ncbi:MAG: hypothetical protein JO144_09620 [Actinobacteria bacterium]|nr:hypothetical protein [Actinomycetota bacterium]
MSASLLVMAGGAVLTAPQASAAVSCSGTITYDHTFNYNGSPAVELTIYYNSTNGGTNSACLYHRGAYYGVAKHTEVQIHRCSQRNPGSVCSYTASSPVDSGNFAYQAGPVGVTGTASYCVTAEGSMAINSTTTLFVSSPVTVGC